MEQLAQVPEVVVAKTADTLLQYGLSGAIIVVLLGFGFFVLRMLLSCMNASIERQAALITVIQEQKSAGQSAATAMLEMARRLEAMERTVQSKMEVRA